MNQVALRDGVHSDTCHFYLEFLEKHECRGLDEGTNAPRGLAV